MVRGISGSLLILFALFAVRPAPASIRYRANVHRANLHRANLHWADEVETITVKLRGLRGLSDDVRAVRTKELAQSIRALPKSQTKVQLAEALANLSTEGDFGQDTLQQVADTLDLAVTESPVAGENGAPASAYIELAELSRHEHVNVDDTSDAYGLALVKVDQMDAARATADFTLTDLKGRKWTRSSLIGHVVLVNFWATWCPPCRKEIPDLELLSKEFAKSGLIVLAISAETDAKVRPFVAAKGMTYPVLLDPGGKVNEKYMVQGIPKSFLYDRDGRMIAQAIDMRTQKQFRAMLALADLR